MRLWSLLVVLAACGGTVEPLGGDSAADSAPETQNDAPEEAEASLKDVDASAIDAGGDADRIKCDLGDSGSVACDFAGDFQVLRDGGFIDCRVANCKPAEPCRVGEAIGTCL